MRAGALQSRFRSQRIQSAHLTFFGSADILVGTNEKFKQWPTRMSALPTTLLAMSEKCEMRTDTKRPGIWIGFLPGICSICFVQSRKAEIRRNTKETRIRVKLDLDGSSKVSIQTGIPFFDHMLTLFARHGVLNLALRCQGDLEVDAHHTVEDCGIALGQAFHQALGDKAGLRRYGTGFHPSNPLAGEAYVPMDECLARCVIDFCGRPCLIWRKLDKLAFKRIAPAEKAQDMSSSFRFGLAREFFQAFANEARCNVHLELLYGEEPHHVVEAIFKAFAKAVDVAKQRDPRLAGQLPSTKGLL